MMLENVPTTNEQPIYRYLNIQPTASEPVQQLLNRNVIGTPGISMCYQHTQVTQKIAQIASPYFVSIMRGTNIAGTCCFCDRVVSVGPLSYAALYVRYFAFNNTFKSDFVKNPVRHRNSLVRKEIQALLGTNGWSTKKGSFFYYAYVDPRNVRSANLCREFGFDRVRSYTTFVFNRLKLRPNNNRNIDILQFKDYGKMQQILKSFYNEYAMFSAENLFNKNDYYVLRNAEGEVVAGLQAVPDNWKIRSFPGVVGLFLPFFSRMPFLKKIIGHNYKFLALEGIYCLEGHESDLQALIESLLSMHQINSAIAVVDTNSSLRSIFEMLDLGFISRIIKRVDGDILCRFNHVADDIQMEIRSRPAYISVTDVT